MEPLPHNLQQSLQPALGSFSVPYLPPEIERAEK